MTESKLKILMDYQRFARNPRLDAMLANAERSGPALLEDDALADVNAAGAPEAVFPASASAEENEP